MKSDYREKKGVRLRLDKQIEDFRQALESNGLLDFGWKWQKFTWCNKQEDGSAISERLDRVVANEKW